METARLKNFKITLISFNNDSIEVPLDWKIKYAFGDTILITKLRDIERIKTLSIQSKTFGIDNKYENFKIFGHQPQGRCACFHIDSTTVKLNGETENFSDGIFIKK